ncbi:TRAP transporter substrate-binding protein DctP [Citricoccus muralis]|uniref:TRAP transporter substrate-binding protein DctP n=1 Tax=Citricoccus muralis TaxID=169134 RepID=A0ABY8H5K1_9MICC|nr:TRAP transporter substrate-binding protein DctP [Citricoccus muralis]WFP16226.1 TRAP transporter substrate-binding protein DctP [Citricoccus muralis]
MATSSLRSTRRFASSVAALSVTVLALGLTACGESEGGGTESIELNVASWATPGSVSEEMGNWWYEQVEERSDGRITFNIDAADSLCSASEIPECVRDGRADLGQSLTDYASQLFPQATISSIPFLNNNSEAVTQAVYDLSQEHEGAAALWEQNGLHPIAHVPPGRLLLGGHTDLASIDDLQNLRLRMAGQYAQHAVDAIGVNSVTLTAPETYEGLERGIADAAAFPLDGTITYQLKDVLPEWTDPGVGTYTTIGMWMNKEVYDSLDDELRSIVDEVTEEFNREHAQRIFTEVTAEQCDALLEDIGDLRQWDESETARWADALGNSLEDRWVEDAERDGLEGAADYLAAYKEKLDTFEGQVREDPAIECAGRS